MNQEKATLISKEPLPNNFKLTFKNQANKEYFLILHENQKEIYSQLELNQTYLYTWKKGNKNYSFINPKSIRKFESLQPSSPASEPHLKNIEASGYLTSPQPSKTGYFIKEKGFFIQQLIKDLQLKSLSSQELLTKTEQLKSKFKRISQSSNIGFALDWIQEVITTLFLKHSQLEKEPNHYYTELEKQESKFLTEIGTMFLQDWIYYYDQRESKYNQHYQNQHSQPSSPDSTTSKKHPKTR